MQEEEFNNQHSESEKEIIKKEEVDPVIKDSHTADEQKIAKPKSFIDRWEQSPYWFVSGSYKVLHSIWMVVMAVGMFLAWLIALLAT